jgi:hypothetical protein
MIFARGISLEQLDDLHLIPFEDQESMPAMFDKQDRMPTSTWYELVEHLETIRPKLMALGTLADVYRGNEIIRTQALAFVRLLHTMAIKNDLGAATLGTSVAFPLRRPAPARPGQWGEAIRLLNTELRPRGEYLTEAEVEKLLKAAKANRNGQRDYTMVLLAYRHSRSKLAGDGPQL